MPALVTLTLLLAAATARANSDEAWLQRATVPGSMQPLLALVVDTSAAMAGPVEALPAYDPQRDYVSAASGAACRPDRVYWRRGPGPAPGCDSAQWISRDAMAAGRGWRCQSGETALTTVGVFVASRAAQWEPRAGGGYWRELRPADDGAVECRSDRGRHGATPGTWFAADGATGPWGDDLAQEPSWDAPPLSDAYMFFTGNYLNYLATPERVTSSRYAWLVQRMSEAARAADGLEAALIRLSHDGLGGDDDGRGGMVALVEASLPRDAATVAEALRSWVPAGPAPLAEALTESGRWLSGSPVQFGLDSQAAPGEASPSVAPSRRHDDPARYRTPFIHACRPATLAMVSAGLASADGGASAAASRVPGLELMAGGCDGRCLTLVAQGLAAGDLVPELAGRQAVALHFVTPSSAAAEVLSAAAATGRPPIDLDEPLAIVGLVAHALQHDAAVGADQRISAAGLEAAAFAAPAAAVYYGLSAPVQPPPWSGNLRKYGLAAPGSPLAAPAVVGRDLGAVFDADSGLVVAGSWSLWADRPDGATIATGGAAAQLPGPAERRVYSDLAPGALDDPANRIDPRNPLLTPAMLELAPDQTELAAELVSWALGQDVFDEDLDGDRDEPRRRLGDPGQRAPRVLRYGPQGTGLAFITSNDGLLHAVDADSGIERWAFMPRAMLPRLQALAGGLRTMARAYGLDGGLAHLLEDANADGRIVAADGDRAWLFVGLGRGGTGYFALDVSDPDRPALLWSLAGVELPGFGDSWPVPVLARMRLDDALQQGDDRVVVLAGGYDPAEDSPVPRASSFGAGVLIVTAAEGRPLWHAAGPGATTANLAPAAMNRSMPSPPRLLDTDGDGLDDRAYVLDISGQLWRLDFPRPGEAGTPTAMRVATLAGGTEPASRRRFFSAPDVVYQKRNGRPTLALAVGSGWLSRPRSTSEEDAFFVVFDDLAGEPPSSPLTAAQLPDVTAAPYEAPPDAPGWMRRLAANGPGEKTAGSSLTFDQRLRFTTYQPQPQPDEGPCGPPAGIVRLYTLDVRTGRPVNWIGDRPVPAEELRESGLPPAIGITVPPVPAGDACAPAGCPQQAFGLLGGSSLFLDFTRQPARTSWRQLDANAE